MLDPIAASRLVRLLVSIIFVGLTVPAHAADRPFVDPPMLSSRHGELVVHLDTAPGAFWIDGRRFDGMLYNGAYMPPIWRVRPGETRWSSSQRYAATVSSTGPDIRGSLLRRQ
jgi:hypothetical protein